MATTSFFIEGDPVAKGRARTATRKKKGGGTYIAHITPPKTEAYERRVRSMAQNHFERPAKGCIELRVVCHFDMPTSYTKAQRDMLWGQYRPMKPDLDNLMKAIKDGCNEVAWLDDAQVVRLLCAKRYIESPDSPVGVSVTIIEL